MFKLLLQHLGLLAPSTARFEVDLANGDMYFATAKFIGIFDRAIAEKYIRDRATFDADITEFRLVKVNY